MKKLSTLFFTMLVLSITVISCKKDDPLGPGNSTVANKCYVTNIQQNNLPFEEFTYENDRLKSFTTHDTLESEPATYNMEYDASGKPVKAVDSRSTASYQVYYSFTYNANNLIKTVEMIFENGTEKISALKFDFNYNATQVSSVRYTSPYLGEDDYMDLIYSYNAKGNVSNIKYLYKNNGELKQVASMNYEYDDKKNPYYELKMPPIDFKYFVLSPNNIVKESYDGAPNEFSTYTYTYTAENYPQTVKYKVAQRPEATQVFTYNCK